MFYTIIKSYFCNYNLFIKITNLKADRHNKVWLKDVKYFLAITTILIRILTKKFDLLEKSY